MHVSRETPVQINERLTRVFAAARFRVLDGAYAYSEYAASAFPGDRAPDALAIVRDDDMWSVLGPARGDEPERLGVVVFHFPPDVDNSGFVGWLASYLKSTLGTGVVVVCGSNRARGGIFDYYGVPLPLLGLVVTALERLRTGHPAPTDPARQVLELRVALTAREFERVATFYREGLGLESAQEWPGDQGRAVVLDLGRAVLEVFDETQAATVDTIEAGARVSGKVRFALQVPDVKAALARLLSHGAVLIHPPVVTPWGDHNVRLVDPDGTHVTLFEVPG